MNTTLSLVLRTKPTLRTSDIICAGESPVSTSHRGSSRCHNPMVMEKGNDASQQRASKQNKRVHFAIDDDDDVVSPRADIPLNPERNTYTSDIYISSFEIDVIQKSCYQLIGTYSKNKDYTRKLEKIFLSPSSPVENFDEAYSVLTKTTPDGSPLRGLESVIVPLISHHRKLAVRSIVALQKRVASLTSEQKASVISKNCQKITWPSVRFAKLLAQVDAVEASYDDKRLNAP